VTISPERTIALIPFRIQPTVSSASDRYPGRVKPVIDGQIDVVVPRAPEGLSLVLKPHHGSRLYRIVPVRDPNQPRFWCLIVLRCSRAGAVEAGEEPWVIGSGLTREQLPQMLAEIQGDLNAWLDDEKRHELRAWLLEQLPDPLDVIRASNETRRRTPAEPEWDSSGAFFPALIQELTPERP
jgi:hypothetical protein